MSGPLAGKQVVVVGGGLAGMAAALSAADHGAGVVLLERRARLGGLTWSFQRNGRWFDNGQHVFLRCCTAYRQFLQRIGATGDTYLQPRLEVPVLSPSGARATIARSSLPAPLHLTGALARYRHLSFADRARLGAPALALLRLRLDDPMLDTMSFGSWLAQHGQSDRAIECLWDLIALPTLNVRAADASLALAAKVFRTGLLDTSEGGDLGWSLVPLRRLHADHGARALADAGVEVVADSQVTAVGPRKSGRRAGGLTVATAERSLDADAVVVATPPEVAEAVLPSGVLPPVERLGVSPIVNVHLVLDRKVTDLRFAACVDSPVQFFFDRTESAGLGASEGQYLAISLSGADEYVGLRPEELIRQFHTALGEVLPVARRARLLDGAVSREHRATFRAAPGTAALRPGARTAVPGLTLAGAWCDTGWPATMEGAVRSGVAAAEQVVAQLGDERPPSIGADRHGADPPLQEVAS